MTEARFRSSHSPVEDLYSIGFKVVTRDAVPDRRVLVKFFAHLKKRTWLRRPTKKMFIKHQETSKLSREGAGKTVCDFWCDEFNIIDAYEGANFASIVYLRTLLAEATIDAPRWNCDRHSSSRPSSSYLSSINEGSSTLCCNLDKDLPPLPSMLSIPFLPAQKRSSSPASVFLPELPPMEPSANEQLFSHPISPTRASSGVFAELVAT